MTEADMPPPERPKSRRREGEQEYLQEDAGMTEERPVSAESAERPREDAGRRKGEGNDKGLLERAKDKLTGE